LTGLSGRGKKIMGLADAGYAAVCTWQADAASGYEHSAFPQRISYWLDCWLWPTSRMRVMPGRLSLRLPTLAAGKASPHLSAPIILLVTSD